ncbi:MAG: glycosyltransferase [Rhodospirillaceae bacterium]
MLGERDVAIIGDGSARYDGREILFLYSSAHDRYLTHRTSVKVYAAAYQKWGIGPHFLDLASENFAAEFLKHFESSALLAVHCEQGWGVDIVLENGQDPFVTYGKPAISHIRDYPFYPWLMCKTLQALPNRLLHYTEASASDFSARFGAVAHRQTHSFAPHIYLDSNPRMDDIYRPQRDRDIDLLYVGSYTDPEKFRSEYLANYKGSERVFDDLIERACHDFHGVYWQHVEAVASSHGIAPDLSQAIYRDLLVQGNQYIRMERRRLLLAKLAPYPLHLIWSGDPPDIKLHPDTVLVSGNTFPETLELMGRAKAMAMCLNNFPCSVSERFLSSMHRGAAVLCHGNVLIDAYFKDGENFLRFDDEFENVPTQIEKLRDTACIKTMTDNARNVVMREFSPERRIEQFLSSLDMFYQGGV